MVPEAQVLIIISSLFHGQGEEASADPLVQLVPG